MALAMIYPEPQQGKKLNEELLKKLKKLGKTENAMKFGRKLPRKTRRKEARRRTC
jgi:hypothetical protein